MSTTITAVEQITAMQEGDPGPMPYPAGQWNEYVTYIRTKDSAPVVLYVSPDAKTKDYYILMKEGESLGENPFEDVRDNLENAKWRVFNNLKYIFTEILMADQAILAGAVAHDNKLKSQYDENGVHCSNFSGDDFNDFKSNLTLDWITGKMECKNAKITGEIHATTGTFKGEINATKGTIGGFTIGTNKLTYSGNDRVEGALSIGPLTISYVSAIPVGTTGAYLKIGGSTSDSSWTSIDSQGNHNFLQGSGNTWNSPGVLMAGMAGYYNSGTIVKDVYWQISALKGITVDKTTSNTLLITHNLGHTNYIVVASPYFSAITKPSVFDYNTYVRVANKTANSFHLIGIRAQGNGDYASFCASFIMVGRNKQISK